VQVWPEAKDDQEHQPPTVLYYMETFDCSPIDKNSIAKQSPSQTPTQLAQHDKVICFPFINNTRHYINVFY